MDFKLVRFQGSGQAQQFEARIPIRHTPTRRVKYDINDLCYIPFTSTGMERSGRLPLTRHDFVNPTLR